MVSDRSPLPLDDAGNGSRLRTITIDEADAYMLARAMMIASNTAMMSGAGTGLRRLNHYRELFLSLAPPAAKLMRNSTDVCELAVALAEAESWSIHRELNWSWDKTGYGYVSIGNRHWGTKEPVSQEEVASIVEMITHLAPLGAVQITREDVLIDRHR